MKAGTRVTLTGVVVPGYAGDGNASARYLRVEVDGSDDRLTVACGAAKAAPTDWSAVPLGTPVRARLPYGRGVEKVAAFLAYSKDGDDDSDSFLVLFNDDPRKVPMALWVRRCEVIE